MERVSQEPDGFFSVSLAERGGGECFTIGRGDANTRVDVRYHALHETIQSTYPVSELGALTSAEPDYGSSARAVKRVSAELPRYIRITDFGEDGIESDHEYLAPEPVEWDSELDVDDVLFARSGSVGKTYLHEDSSERAIFAGYCIRFRFDESKASPRFVYWWTKTEAYARWVAAIQRPSVQSNINKEEFKTCPIPLPPVGVQDGLTAEMSAARAERKAKLAEADALMRGVDDFVMDALGIESIAEDSRRVFALPSGNAFARLDPYFHSPQFARIKNMISQTSCELLGDIATFSRETWTPQEHSRAEFRYIEISGVNPDTGEASWNELLTSDAPSRARMKVKSDDIIVSLTRPHHGSIAHLGPEFEGCIASTGFGVIRNVAGHVRRDYLWCMLRTQNCRYQMIQRASGGNYPAITQSELANIIVPVPDTETQNRIIAEITRRRETARRLRAEAEDGWQSAKRRFERRLLRGEGA